MKELNILYFASLREAVGCAGERLPLPEGVRTVGALREHLAARGGVWTALTAGRNLRAAVNQRMVDGDAPLAPGDEIAFFPPVTGG